MGKSKESKDTGLFISPIFFFFPSFFLSLQNYFLSIDLIFFLFISSQISFLMTENPTLSQLLSISEQEAGVPIILDPTAFEDQKTVDNLAVALYLSAFHHRTSIKVRRRNLRKTGMRMKNWVYEKENKWN
jgi:hypothetical protein